MLLCLFSTLKRFPSDRISLGHAPWSLPNEKPPCRTLVFVIPPIHAGDEASDAISLHEAVEI
jgi:hypothetical protein